MPRFHLNIRRNGVFIEDPDGDEVENLEAARQIAIESLNEMRRFPHVYGEPEPGVTKEFVITDEAGTVLLTIPFDRKSE